MTTRTPYPTDVSDEEWACIAPSWVWLPLTVEQRRHALREVFIDSVGI
jgi:hypothetical protein